MVIKVYTATRFINNGIRVDSGVGTYISLLGDETGSIPIRQSLIHEIFRELRYENFCENML